MRESKEEMRVFREEMQADRQAMNKKWGELANKMGTLVEDIVAPNQPRIFKDYFGVAFDELDLFALRLQKKHRSERSKRREFDAVGISDRFVFINETKSKPDRRDIDSFAKVIGEVADYFPEAEKLWGFFRRCICRKG